MSDNKKFGRFQIGLWAERTEYKNLRSVRDPFDLKGLRNKYIDLVHKICLSREIGFSRKDKILHFGCGIGQLSFWAFYKVSSVIGIDVREKSIAKAKEIQRQEGTNVDFQTYNGLDIPFQAVTFDKVISCWVWQHILEPEDFQATVREVCRLLKEDGKICFIEQVAKQKIIPKDFAEDYVIQRIPEEYIKEFGKRNCKLVKCYPINARGQGLFYKLICRNFIPKFFNPFIPLFAKFDLLLTRRMGIPKKGSVDYLFSFEKSQG